MRGGLDVDNISFLNKTADITQSALKWGGNFSIGRHMY